MAESAEAAQQGWRVKLYQLNAHGQWDDRGTGQIRIVHVDSLGGPGINIVSEMNGQEILQCRIVEGRDAYSLQGDNIITWEERGANGAAIDLAVSFQEAAGCMHVMNQIQEVQGTLKSMPGGDEDVPIGPEPFSQSVPEFKALPECRVQNLSEICELVMNANPAHRDAYASALLAEDCAYLTRITHLFSDCEDLDDTENLKLLAYLMRSVVMLNEPNLVEVVLSPKFFEHVVGAIEYDPDLKEKANFRHFLQHEARLREVVPMDETLRARCVDTFHAVFLREAVTRPGMDETALSSLSQIIYCSQSEILNRLHTNTDYLQRVVRCILDGGGEAQEPPPSTGPGSPRIQALCFLREMCGMAKINCVQAQTREALFHHLVGQTDIYEAVAHVLADSQASPRERRFCTEVLTQIVAFDSAASLREYVRKAGRHPPAPPWSEAASRGGAGAAAAAAASSVAPPRPGAEEAGEGGPQAAGSGGADGDPGAVGARTNKSLMALLIHYLVHSDDVDVLLNCAEAVRSCVDTELLEATERDSFLTLFYDYYLHWLVDPIVEHTSEEARGAHAHPPPLTVAKKSSFGHICDILSYCVKSHTYRMKYFVLRNNLVGRILELLHQRDKFLKLAALRFVRQCIGAKDEFYNRYIVKHNLLAPVFTLFAANQGRDNLVSSAIIDMIDFVRTENIKSLVEYSVENFATYFEDVEYVETFKNLHLRYEQNLELRGGEGTADGATNGAETIAAAEMRKAKEVDDDEAYFDGDDEEEEDGPVPHVAPQPAGSDPDHAGAGPTEASSVNQQRSPSRDLLERRPASPPLSPPGASPPKTGLGRVFDIAGPTQPRPGPLRMQKIELMTKVDTLSRPDSSQEGRPDKRQKV